MWEQVVFIPCKQPPGKRNCNRVTIGIQPKSVCFCDSQLEWNCCIVPSFYCGACCSFGLFQGPVSKVHPDISGLAGQKHEKLPANLRQPRAAQNRLLTGQACKACAGFWIEGVLVAPPGFGRIDPAWLSKKHACLQKA